MHRIAVIGAGNVATHLSRVLASSGNIITQIYSRTEESAKVLAGEIGCSYTTSINEISPDADIYIVSVKDSVLQNIIKDLVKCNPDALYVHTAGSVSIDIWENLTERYGVLYPMQTFSKEANIDFNTVSFFIEANNKADCMTLRELASKISPHVYEATSEQRKHLHIAAVFACNFVNHMYHLSQNILNVKDLPFEAILPLIDETARKVHHLSPKEAQTGPAVREDFTIMNDHKEILMKLDPDLCSVYSIISKSIIDRKS